MNTINILYLLKEGILNWLKKLCTSIEMNEILNKQIKNKYTHPT